MFDFSKYGPITDAQKSIYDKIVLQAVKEAESHEYSSALSENDVTEITEQASRREEEKILRLEQRRNRRREREILKQKKADEIEQRVNFVGTFIRKEEERKRIIEEERLKRENELKTHNFFQLDPTTGQKKLTGVVYFGDTKNAGSAWVPHGTGKFIQSKNHEKVLYEGSFYEGKMHGKGIFYFENGDSWEGYFRMDDLHGIGKYTHASNRLDKKKQEIAIYRKNCRICFTCELYPGVSILLSDSMTNHLHGAMIIKNLKVAGHYHIRMDDGHEKNVNLGETTFVIDHTRVVVCPLETILEEEQILRKRKSYSFSSQTNSCTTEYDENFFFDKSNHKTDNKLNINYDKSFLTEFNQKDEKIKNYERLQKESYERIHKEYVNEELKKYREKIQKVESLKMKHWNEHEQNVAKLNQKLVERRLNEQTKIDKNRRNGNA